MSHETKVFEIRDRETLIVAVAVRVAGDGATRAGRLLRRGGYGHPVILLAKVNGGCRGTAHDDPYDWGDRTMNAAHCYIEEHWDGIDDGGIVDVRVPLGEADAPCASEVD